ncbi:hypothetical protein EUGRSUZ_H02733 [Eucalyptus grandis]|uniref:Uncharacterized protein n=2 Tax=Eucalyptus grandis TaxID=71139 RepID=A0ACC3JTT1_EUCGR|nr:hypothetical protein EUGRSUZ_H02733 [Eucalyptus grandis]
MRNSSTSSGHSAAPMTPGRSLLKSVGRGDKTEIFAFLNGEYPANWRKFIQRLTVEAVDHASIKKMNII